MSSLYELTGAYLELEDMLLDDEVDEQTVLDTLEGVKGEIAEHLKSLPEDVELPWAHLEPRGKHLSIK